jgi:Fic family protein
MASTKTNQNADRNIKNVGLREPATVYFITTILKVITRSFPRVITQKLWRKPTAISILHKLFDQTKSAIQNKLPKICSKKLIELSFEQPCCKSEYLENRLNISRITASKYFRALEKIKVLQSKKVWKETRYINTELSNLSKK